MKTTKDLKQGDWFVASCDASTRLETKYRRVGFDRIRRFKTVTDENPLHVVCACEYESSAQMIAQMYACLPHESAHQLSNGDSYWVVGIRGRGRVYLREFYQRCFDPNGRVADKHDKEGQPC